MSPASSRMVRSSPARSNADSRLRCQSSSRPKARVADTMRFQLVQVQPASWCCWSSSSIHSARSFSRVIGVRKSWPDRGQDEGAVLHEAADAVRP